MSPSHQAVLLDEVVAHLAPVSPVRIIDGTVGYGGHAGALLDRWPESELLGIDRDEDALRSAAAVLAPFGERVHLVHGRYSEMDKAAADLGWTTVDAILLDIGVSSAQLDTPLRGFSYRFDGPLDMRMDRRDRLTASVILNTWSEEQLRRIFRDYGEERHARRVAAAIVRRREKRPWAKTGELAALLDEVIGRRAAGGLPPATRCFQALRIAVNRELAELEQGLRVATELLRAPGRLAVISFHSLEDRIVKHFIRHEAATCVCPPGCPVCICGKVARLRAITRRPIRASAAEIERNPRSSSAKMRVAERLPDDPDKARPGAAVSGRRSAEKKR